MTATRAEQWAAFARALAAIAVIGLITVAAAVEVLRIGPAAAGLLYLLPVLWVSARAGLGAGLASAGFAAFCYNYYLLAPRYSLRIHGVDDVAAFVVLFAVAVVTSRLASSLRTRELEARARADASEAEAAFGNLLAKASDRAALDDAALAALRERYGEAMLVRGDDLLARRTGLAPLDAAAANWALQHDALSGQASEVMPAADFRFVPLAGEDVLALGVGPHAESHADPLARALARLWVQARDRLLADAERRAREEAEAREAVRRTLLAALGHDFRTPLTVIKSELAELGGEAAARLGAEVDRLVRLTEDLIGAARLEHGPPARLEPVDLVDAVAAAMPRATGVEIRLDLPDELSLVRADPVMLTHLLRNLLDNALRHAHATVAVIGREVAGDVALRVEDDGDGIDPAIAGTLFDRFTAGSDRQGGSGLGLAIARDLAHAMGGTLTGADRPAGGAVFTLSLPVSGR